MNRLPTGQLNSPFLGGLTQPEVSAVVAAASRHYYSPKTLVTEEGELANYFFLLVSGRARYFFLTEGGKKIILHWLLPGEIVGMMALLSEPMPYQVSSETVRQTSMLVWERGTIRSLLGRYPKLLDNALFVAAQYLLLYRLGYTALVCDSAKERLANVLGDLAKIMGRPLERGVELNVTNEELASAANVTPFTASRLLADWQRKGLISKTRSRIIVFSPTKFISQAPSTSEFGMVWGLRPSFFTAEKETTAGRRR